MNDVPSEEPHIPATPPSTDEASGPRGDRILRLAQLGLRLLGVMFLVDGIAAIVGGATQYTFYARWCASSGQPEVIEPHSMGWLATGVVQLALGFYLMVDGRWVLGSVFLPPRKRPPAKQ